MEFNKENLERLLDDAAYLQDEVEALKYVIHNVPFDEKPGGSESILEMVALIDHAQMVYYRPIVERFRANGSPDLSDIDPDFRKSFSLQMDEGDTVETVLNRIIKHRAALLNIATQIPTLAWQKRGEISGKEQTLFDILQDMISFERNQLKLVADRVMAIERETPKPGNIRK